MGEAPTADLVSSDASVAILVSGETSTAEQGGPTGAPFGDTCPVDQAVVGYRGFLTPPPVGLTLIGGVQTLCGVLTLGASSPLGIATSPGATLPMRGASRASPWTQVCPADQVVVGFSGRSGAALDQVAFECAPWFAADAGGVGLSVGGSVTLMAAGRDGGMPFEDLCPPGQLARGTSGRSGQWVDSLALLCGSPTPSTDSGAP